MTGACADAGQPGMGAGLDPNLWEQLAHHPGLAARLLRLEEYLVYEARWTDREDLRELVLQVANRELPSTYLHMARIDAAFEARLSPLKLASLDFVREEVFDEDERFVIGFTRAVLHCSVPDGQFAEARERFGQRGVVQLIATISAWRWLAIVASVLAPRPRRVRPHGEGTA